MDIVFVKKYLHENLGFSDEKIHKIHKYIDLLLIFNKKYNLISKTTEKEVWNRHILDSAQIIKYIDFNKGHILTDFGSGAGLPGVILSIANTNPNFHVKLYEKSSVKRKFLNLIKKKLNIKCDISENVYNDRIIANIIVSRAFKKIEEIIKISREIVKKPHKIIILKGKSAQAEINTISLASNYSYKLVNSITDSDSRIILIEAR